MNSKYNARKTTIYGITFDSKKESSRYCELRLLEVAGKITDLILQPMFILQEDFDKNNRHYRAITYKADFQYKENGKTIVEDCKGFRTKEYQIKKKLFEKRFKDLTISEI